MKISISPFYLLAAAGLTFLVSATLAFWILSSEIRSTMVKYLIDDTFLGSKKYNLMLGSSTIERLSSNDLKQCGNWLNRGIGGSTLVHVNTYLKFSPLDIAPENILLYAGENDISFGASVESTMYEYTAMIDHLSLRFPDAKIHILPIKHSPKRTEQWNNFDKLNLSMRKSFDTREKVVFIPSVKHSSELFKMDGLHYTNVGYQHLIERILKSCKTN